MPISKRGTDLIKNTHQLNGILMGNEAYMDDDDLFNEGGSIEGQYEVNFEEGGTLPFGIKPEYDYYAIETLRNGETTFSYHKKEKRGGIHSDQTLPNNAIIITEEYYNKEMGIPMEKKTTFEGGGDALGEVDFMLPESGNMSSIEPMDMSVIKPMEDGGVVLGGTLNRQEVLNLKDEVFQIIESKYPNITSADVNAIFNINNLYEDPSYQEVYKNNPNDRFFDKNYIGGHA